MHSRTDLEMVLTSITSSFPVHSACVLERMVCLICECRYCRHCLHVFAVCSGLYSERIARTFKLCKINSYSVHVYNTSQYDVKHSYTLYRNFGLERIGLCFMQIFHSL